MKNSRLNALAVMILSAIFLSQSVFAVSVGPTEKYFEDVQPGETLSGEINIGNTEKVPKILTLTATDVFIDPATNTEQYIEEGTPNGVANWLSFEKEAIDANPGDTFPVKYTIKVPNDAEPGLYWSKILASTKAPDEEGVSQAGASAAAVSKVYVTVAGDFTEEVSLESFRINKGKLVDGLIEFDTSVKNSGDIYAVPTGSIKIYNESGEQVKGVHAITQTFEEGNEVVTSREDAIPINVLLRKVLPGESRVYNTPVKFHNLEKGTYIAKLDLYYGQENVLLEAEDEFSVSEASAGSKAGLKVLNPTTGSLPVNFEVNLHNTGDTTLEITGTLEIKNILGATKETINLSQEPISLSRGENKVVELSWSDGMAMGMYTANLTLNSGGEIIVDNATIWVVSWWQILILVIVILLIVFLIIKGVSSYGKMKHKMEELEEEIEHKEENKEEKKE